MVIFSSFLYFAEQTEEEFDEDEELWFYTEDSDDPFSESPFQSIPHTLWWCIGKLKWIVFTLLFVYINN